MFYSQKETDVKTLLPLVAVLLLGACVTRGPSEVDRLAMINANAGAPVNQIRYFNAMGWERVDSHHVLLSMRPRETWLLTVSGPCLDWGSGSPVMGLSSNGGFVYTKFDRITTAGSPASCRIEEIRPVDAIALRKAEAIRRAQSASGT